MPRRCSRATPRSGRAPDRGHAGRRGAQEPDEAGAGAGPRAGGDDFPLRAVRRGDRRRGPGRACDRGLRSVRGPLDPGAGSACVWRTGRRQRAHRELSGISDRRLGAGADGARVHAGAEIRRRVQPVHRGQAAGLHFGTLGARSRAHPRARRWPAGPGARGRGRHGRALSPSGDPEPRAVRGPRRLVLGLAGRGSAVPRRADGLGGRRKLGGPGGGVPGEPRATRAHARARPEPSSTMSRYLIDRIAACPNIAVLCDTEVVELSATPTRVCRACGGATGAPEGRNSTRSPTCSSSPAPIPRRAGSPDAAFRSTRRASSEPAPKWVLPIAPCYRWRLESKESSRWATSVRAR